MGIIVILAIWTTVVASITTAKEAAMDRARSEGRNLAAAFADELTQILGGVAGAMEIVAQRMRTARGAFDIHAWAHEIPLLSNATIQAGIIGPDGRLVSTTHDPAPEPIDLWEFLSPRAREGQCLPAWVRRAAHWQGRAASAVCKKSEWLRRRGLSLLIPGDAAGFSVVCTNRPLAASGTSHAVFRRAHDMRTQFCTSDHAIPAEILGSRRTRVSVPRAREGVKTLATSSLSA